MMDARCDEIRSIIREVQDKGPKLQRSYVL